MRIYDELGRQRDPDWLATMFGPQVRVDASPESPAFRVVEVRASTSEAAVVTLLDGQGRPMPDVAVVFAHTSENQVVREKTDQKGQISVPLDRSYRYGVPAQAGPCHAGIPRTSTDVIYGLGEVIVAGAANRHLDVAFQWLEEAEPAAPEEPVAPVEPAEPEPPDPPPDVDPAPPPVPVESPWQELLAKLDRIIELLEGMER